MFFFQEGFTYRNFLMDVLTIFFFIVWFWLLITVASEKGTAERARLPDWALLGHAGRPRTCLLIGKTGRATCNQGDAIDQGRHSQPRHPASSE